MMVLVMCGGDVVSPDRPVLKILRHRTRNGVLKLYTRMIIQYPIFWVITLIVGKMSAQNLC